MAINNNAIYNAAINGVIAGQERWIKSHNSSGYNSIATSAESVAAAVDAQIAPGAITSCQASLMEAILTGVFADRHPNTVTDWTDIAQAAAALYNRITPDLAPCPSSAGGVTTFNGRGGAVVSINTDYSSDLIANNSGVAGAFVTNALNTLNTVATNTTKGLVPTAGAANTFLSSDGTNISWVAVISPPANPGDNGALPIATNGNFTYLADGTTGQALIATGVGSAPVWGSNFGATELLTTGSFRANATTGFFQVGTNTAGATRAATVGNVRGPALFQVFARNSTDALNVNLLDWGVGAVDNLQIGRTTANLILGSTTGVTAMNSSSGIFVVVGTGVFIMRPTRFDLSSNITGIQSINAFLINIADTVGVAAQGSRATVAGQNATGTGATFGGPVQLIPGTGAQSGNLELFGSSGSVVDNSMAGGIYMKDRSAVPIGNPINSGLYHWSDTGGLPTWRTAAGNTVQLTGIGFATASAGGGAATPGTVLGFTGGQFMVGGVLTPGKLPVYAT